MVIMEDRVQPPLASLLSVRSYCRWRTFVNDLKFPSVLLRNPNTLLCVEHIHTFPTALFFCIAGVKDAFDDALNSLLGLEAEYIAMIGMGIMIVLLVITIIVILCTVGSRRK